MNAGDVLCEIQTDKAVVALEADEDGKLAKIVKDKDAGTLKVPYKVKNMPILLMKYKMAFSYILRSGS